MSSELAVRPPSTDEMQVYMQQADLLSRSGIVPTKFRGKPADVLVAALQGRELGWGVTTAMTYIDVIQGVPTISAAGRVALIRARGHSITGEANNERAKVTGTRADNGDSITVEFTIEEARQKGLAGKDNWKKHTADMLWARAVSRLSRRLFEDCMAGCTYDPTEIDEDAEPPSATVTEINPELAASVARHPSSLGDRDVRERVVTGTGEIVDVVEPAAVPFKSNLLPGVESTRDIGTVEPDEKKPDEAHKKRMAALHASLHETFALPPGKGRSDKEATAKDTLLAKYGVESASDLTAQQVSALIDRCKKDPASVRAAAGLAEPVSEPTLDGAA